jgi:hypothetical protein
MLFYYSGLIACFFTIFLIILPASIAPYNRIKYPLSQTGTLHLWGLLFNLGCILSGIFQIIFINYLNLIFFSNHLNFAVIIYMLGAISLIGVGLIHINSKRKTHNILAIGFCMFNSLGGIFFSISLMHINFNLGLISGIFAVLEWFFLLSVCKILKEVAFAELLGVLFSVLWAVSFYLIK